MKIIDVKSNERRIIFLLSAVQFVQIMDFTMMLPLGPDLSKPFGIPASLLPLLVATQMCAATILGIIAASRLESINRKSALIVAMVGLAIADSVCSMATNLPWLIMSRFVAGAFGGLAASQGLAMLADVIPEARRGRAVASVLKANDIASLAGVPFALWLAHALNWQAPFQTVASVALLVAVGLLWTTVSIHTAQRKPERAPIRVILRNPQVRQSYAMTFLVAMSTFLIITNLSAFMQYNLSLPRSDIPMLYMLAGVFNFVVLSRIGQAVDRWGSFNVGSIAILLFSGFIIVFIVRPEGLFLIPITFSLIPLLVSLSARNIAVRTLTTKVPAQEERGRFMSLQSAVQQIAAAIGAISSSAILNTTTDGQLIGMPTLGFISIAMSLATLILLRRVERGLC